MDMRDGESLVHRALDDLNAGLAGRDAGLAARFHADAMFIGSEPGESARGQDEIGRLFAAIAQSPNSVAFDWASVEVQGEGAVIWFLACGDVAISGGSGTVRRSYSLSGVLERAGDDYRWRLFHGSEPWIAPGR